MNNDGITRKICLKTRNIAIKQKGIPMRIINLKKYFREEKS